MRMTCFQHPGRFGAAFPPRYLGLTVVLCLLAPWAQAARPMITDDARITDAQSCQLESWTRNNHGNTEYWALPACNFTDNLELTAGGAVTHGGQRTSLTDVVLQGKTVLKDLEPNGWGAALSIGSTRHPRVSDAGRDWYATVPASFSFKDDRVVLHTNLGWLREQATLRDRLTWGIGSETELSQRDWLIAEIFGLNQGKPNYQVGLRHWLVPGRVQVDATYGKRFGRATDESWFSLGLRVLSLAQAIGE